MRLAVAGIAFPALPMQSEAEKNSVSFGVFGKPLYYPTKRENKKISEISVYFTFCWFVGIKEKSIRRSIGKNFSSPWRETAGRKGILICLVSEKRAETAVAIALLVKPEKPKRPAEIVVLADAAGSVTFLEQDSTAVPKFAFRSFCPCGNLVGECLPQTLLMRLTPLIPPQPCGSRKEVFTMRKRYNTPHRSRVVKTRMTEEEYAEFAQRLSAYNMSQAEFIRQAITGAAIRPIITVSPVNDELLAAVGKLTAEYGRIGGNLNQIARTLNEWHSPYPQLAGEVRAAVSDLAALKFEVLQKVGDAVGNIQTYQL